MRIGMLAPLWKTLPPHGYGGSEQVVSMLTEALVAAGHDVTLFACKGTKTSAKLVEVIDEPMYDKIGGKFLFDAIQPYDLVGIQLAIEGLRAGDFDIIHNHMGHHPVVIAGLAKALMVTTLHSSLPPDFPELAHAARAGNFVSISNAQRSLCPELNYVETIYHGIDTAQFLYNDSPDDYLLFMATMWKEKGVDRAIEIAKRAGKRLIMAGDIRRQSDFDEIKPLIDGQQVVYLGEVDAKTKLELYRGASAYLFPIRWNEAFGLVVPEALACGTPVIAYPNGSLPELIEDGKTGFLVDSIEAAVDAVGRVTDISRQYCHDQAVARFDATVMAANYAQLYQKLVG